MARTALIVKLAAIGDVVMAMPMVTALRAADPGTRITWMVGKAATPVLAAFEGIDELLVVDEADILVGTPARKPLPCSTSGAAWAEDASTRSMSPIPTRATNVSSGPFEPATAAGWEVVTGLAHSSPRER